MDIGRLVATSPDIIGADIGRATAIYSALRDYFRGTKIGGDGGTKRLVLLPCGQFLGSAISRPRVVLLAGFFYFPKTE
jgi:hypothetical protein